MNGYNSNACYCICPPWGYLGVSWFTFYPLAMGLAPQGSHVYYLATNGTKS